jgi:hypothetical protein
MFEKELSYRVGAMEYDRLREEDEEAINLYKDIDYENEAEMEKAAKRMRNKMKDFVGFKIEESIPLEDDTTGSAFPPYILSYFHTNLRDFGYIHLTRSVLGKQNTRTMKELKEIGLIDEKIYHDALAMPKGEWVINVVELVDFLLERAAFYEDFDENKKEELALIDTLRRQGMMSKENQEKLIASYRTFELKGKFEILRYCEKAIIFEVHQLPSKPEKAYAIIFEQVKTILPSFNFTNLQAKLTTNEDILELREQSIHLSLEVEGRKYQSTFLYDYIEQERYEKYGHDSLLQLESGVDFYRIVNRFLTRQGSEYRLYYANTLIDGEVVYTDQFGLILMTEPQAKVWGHHSDFVFMEKHDNTFSQENIQVMVANYESIGLFKHLSASEMAQGKNKLQEVEIEYDIDILRCFPKVVVDVSWENISVATPYEALLKKNALASRGAFNPTHIIDDFKKNQGKQTTRLSFVLNKQKYNTNLDRDDLYLSDKCIDLIKKAMKEQSIGGTLYDCPNEQYNSFIFLTPSQYVYLKETQPKLFER